MRSTRAKRFDPRDEDTWLLPVSSRDDDREDKQGHIMDLQEDAGLERKESDRDSEFQSIPIPRNSDREHKRPHFAQAKKAALVDSKETPKKVEKVGEWGGLSTVKTEILTFFSKSFEASKSKTTERDKFRKMDKSKASQFESDEQLARALQEAEYFGPRNR